MSKVTLVLAAAAGYVLGARAGRERYDEIAGAAQRAWSDPRVQRRADQAQGIARAKGKEAGAKVSEKVSDVVHRDDGDSTSSADDVESPKASRRRSKGSTAEGGSA